MHRLQAVANTDGFYVKGTIEEAYERAQSAIEEIAKARVEKVQPPDWVGLIDFFESLDRESDRAVPILAFAFIDAEFSRLLRETLNPEVSGGVATLFGPLGPLGSASTRFNMAHALHWITNETVEDLHLLRRIRNRLAHELVEEHSPVPRDGQRLRFAS